MDRPQERNAMISIANNTTSPPDVGGYELAEEETGLCRGTLYSLVHQRRIPHIRVSRRMVRFRRAELRAWLDARTVEARA